MDILKRDFLERVLTGRKSGALVLALGPARAQRWLPPSLVLQLPHQHSKKLERRMSLKVFINVTNKKELAAFMVNNVSDTLD